MDLTFIYSYLFLFFTFYFSLYIWNKFFMVHEYVYEHVCAIFCLCVFMHVCSAHMDICTDMCAYMLWLLGISMHVLPMCIVPKKVFISGEVSFSYYELGPVVKIFDFFYSSYEVFSSNVAVIIMITNSLSNRYLVWFIRCTKLNLY